MANGLLGKLYQCIDDRDRWRREELSFLPAALEIQETPPSPIGRAIIWSIVSLFSIAILWSLVGRIDIVAVAPGKIIPSDRVKVVQPLEIGVVQAIHVTEGKQVAAGEALITLDTTQTESDRTRLGNELFDARLRRQRQSLFLEYLTRNGVQAPTLETPLMTEDIPSGVVSSKLAFQGRLLEQQLEEYRSRRQALQSEHEKQIAAQQTALSEVTKAERVLPLLKQRTEALGTLLEDNLVSREHFLEIQQQYIELQQDLITQQSRVSELDAAIASLEQQQRTLTAETRRSALEAQEQTAQQEQALAQELRKADQRNRQQVLYAPIAGTVQQLAVHTVGGVVTPAQELMLIVPEENRIEVEAFIRNQDIGFVEEGQIAEVKIDAFNFTKYGVIDGEILNISNDAIEDEALGLVYLCKILLEDTKIQVDNRLVSLSPGMSVAVEIKTGTRRLIEYFLSPILRFKQESIRER